MELWRGWDLASPIIDYLVAGSGILDLDHLYVTFACYSDAEKGIQPREMNLKQREAITRLSFILED